MMRHRRPLPSRSRGATLVVALIFLVLMGLFAISAFNSSGSNMRVVGNTQARQESTAAAQLALERTISSSDFVANPAGVESTPIRVDMDGDGKVDYTAKMTPAPKCFRAQAITKLPPAPKRGSDVYSPCRTRQQQGGTFEEYATPSGEIDPESCANTEWNVRSTVSDPSTHTEVALNQGVAVVAFGNQVSSQCK